MAWPAPQTTPLAGTPQQLHHRCESGQFQFETTQELVGLMPSHGIWAGATPLVNSSNHRRVKKITLCHSKNANLNFNLIEPICIDRLLNFSAQLSSSRAALF
jgi:hypothetical protein